MLIDIIHKIITHSLVYHNNYIHQDIHFRSHIKGTLDLTKSALQARFYQLKPFLNFNPDKITPNIQQAYLTTWCKNSILGSFQQRKVVFHPLQTPQTSHQS